MEGQDHRLKVKFHFKQTYQTYEGYSLLTEVAIKINQNCVEKFYFSYQNSSIMQKVFLINPLRFFSLE